jgi:hypothetical protein
MHSWLNDVRPEDVSDRATVARLAPLDPDQALVVARAIRHPWYRCQAITSVAEIQPSNAVSIRLLNEALSAAREQSEPNRIVSVASWPLKHLAKVAPEIASVELSRLLPIIEAEPHALRRLDGLFRLLGSVASVPELRESVKPSFVATAAVSHGWRSERLVAFAALLLFQFDSIFARTLLASRKPNRFVKRAERELQSCNAIGNA